MLKSSEFSELCIHFYSACLNITVSDFIRQVNIYTIKLALVNQYS